MKNFRHMLFSLVVVLALLFSNFGPISVFADDTVPTPEQTEEAVVEEPAAEAPVEQQTVESPSSETTQSPDPVEGGEETEAPTDDGSVQETPEATEEPTLEGSPEAPVGETVAAPQELSDEDLDTLPEILAQAPKGTEIIILNSEGEPESLASEEAANILVKGDPVWCPGTSAPGSAGCTASHISFASLIAELSTGGFTGAGTIWVAYDYDLTQDNNQIVFNADPTYNAVTNPNPLNNLTDLTINGGWTGGSTLDPAQPSEIDVSMVFANWIGNITLNNIFIHNTTDDVGFGLSVDTDGNVTMNNVSVSGTTGTSSILNEGDGDGARIVSTGNVTIADSSFDTNDGNGLVVNSGGNTVLTNVSASGNTLTGAYLDTCQETVAVCLDSGDVTITGSGSLFTNNSGNGLVIDAGGSTYLDGITSQDNGLNGAYIKSGDIGEASSLEIQSSNFSGNTNASGLLLYHYADGTVTLNSVIAEGNDLGTEIYTTSALSLIDIIDSQFYHNVKTGLHVESDGNITLTGVTAGSLALDDGLGNGSNGAYLVTAGNINVTNSTFNENVHFSSPQDPGIYAKAGGNILLNAVEASNNVLGAGAVLLTTGTGDITINNGSVFNNNGTFGLQANISAGVLTLDTITADSNAVKGVYLIGKGTSNIFIINSGFFDNGNYGIYASVDEGNIDINSAVIVDGNDVTQTGAKLINNGSGTVNVSGSTFQNMLGAGLSVIANGIVTLNNNIFDNNNGNGAEIYSTYTVKKCYCPGAVNTSVIVSIIGGTFQNNGQYGLFVKPGDEGSVDISTTTPPTFLPANASGDYLIDTSPISECSDCNCVKPEKPAGKPYNIIDVPFSGSGNVPQQCSIYAGTILQMEDGTFVKVGCPFSGFSSLQGLHETDLPGLLGAGSDFDLGVLLGLLGEDGSFVLNSDGTITLTFKIPENTRGRSHRLLFWDTTLNDGAGGWYQMPPFEFGTSFPLHPDDPEDPRMIVSGVAQYGDTMTVTVNFAGYFVVVGN